MIYATLFMTSLQVNNKIIELIFYLIFHSNLISSHIHLLICLLSPAFHYSLRKFLK
jgi:hypothetical protein